jgi:hypothetical protein
MLFPFHSAVNPSQQKFRFLLFLAQAFADKASPHPLVRGGHRALAATCYPSVRTIRLSSSGELQPIQMFELQAYTNAGEEVATKKVATQSSTFANNPKYAASKATDGDVTTFSHTSDSNASWEVNLGQNYSIDSVHIKNRWCKSKDDAPGCLCRLSNAKLSLLDEKGSVVMVANTGNTCGKLELEYGFSHACTEVCVGMCPLSSDLMKVC